MIFLELLHLKVMASEKAQYANERRTSFCSFYVIKKLLREKQEIAASPCECESEKQTRLSSVVSFGKVKGHAPIQHDPPPPPNTLQRL